MELFPLKAYSTKCSLQSLQIIRCLDLEGVLSGVSAVSDSCDTCNKVIKRTELNVLPLPQNSICVAVSSHFVLQCNGAVQENVSTVGAGMIASMQFLLYFSLKYLNITKVFQNTYLYLKSYASFTN